MSTSPKSDRMSTSSPSRSPPLRGRNRSMSIDDDGDDRPTRGSLPSRSRSRSREHDFANKISGHKAPFSKIKLPDPGDDATPFVLRVHARQGPFKPLKEFDHGRRDAPQVKNHEFKLYVWRTATLREVAALLHLAQPNISTPTTHHAFRLVYFDSRRSEMAAREIAGHVTRVNPLLPADQGLLPPAIAEKLSKEVEAVSNERAAKTTLQDINVVDGDMIDVSLTLPSHTAAGAGRGSREINIRGGAGTGRRIMEAKPQRGPPSLADVPSAMLGAAHPWGPAPGENQRRARAQAPILEPGPPPRNPGPNPSRVATREPRDADRRSSYGRADEVRRGYQRREEEVERVHAGSRDAENKRSYDREDARRSSSYRDSDRYGGRGNDHSSRRRDRSFSPEFTSRSRRSRSRSPSRRPRRSMSRSRSRSPIRRYDRY